MTTSNIKALESIFFTHQMQHALYEAARAARVILQVDASILFLLNSAEQLVAAAWHGREAADTSISLKSSSIRALWAGRRSMMWDRRERCSDPEIGAILDSMGLVSCLIMPLVLNGTYFGIWMVASAGRRPFTENEESIVHTFSENIGLTTESLLLSEDNLRYRREANALIEIGKEISQLMDLDRVLELIVKKTCALLNAEISYLALADDERQEVRVRITEGTRADLLKKMVLKYGEGVGGLVATSRLPMLVDNYPADPRPKPPGVAETAASEGIVSIISVPLFTRKALIGVLFAASRREAVFNHSQVDLLYALGTQAAIAIENARLYAQEKVTTDRLRQTMTTHEQLLNLVLGNQGLEAIADTLAGLIACPVMVEDATHHPLCFSFANLKGASAQPAHNHGLTTADIWNDPELADRIYILREVHHIVRIPPRPEKHIFYPRAVAPIAAGRTIYGYIIALEIGHELSDPQLSTIEQASIVLALEFLKQEAAQTFEQRLAGDFLNDLIFGRGLANPIATQRAARLNINLKAHHRILILNIDDFSEAVERNRWTDLDALAIKRRFLTTVTEVVRKTEGSSALVSTQSENVLALLPDPLSASLEAVKALAARLQKSLPIALPDLTISIGIGRVAEEPAQLQRSFADATLALRVASWSGQKGAVAVYEDLGVLPLILQSDDQKGLLNFMQQHLERLLAYDRENQAALVATLQAYLHNNGNLQRTAVDCHVHINSIKYRLQRIEEIAGIDLHDGQTRFNLQLALSIHSTMQILKPE